MSAEKSGSQEKKMCIYALAYVWAFFIAAIVRIQNSGVELYPVVVKRQAVVFRALYTS